MVSINSAIDTLPLPQNLGGTGKNTYINLYPNTPFIVGAIGSAGYQTIQSALTAANAAGGGIVYVQPGTYTENLTLFTNTQVVGAVGASDVGGGVTIIGVHTPPASGNFTFSKVILQSATHIFSSVAAGSTSLFVLNCLINITNGYIFNLLNWTGLLVTYDVGDISTNNGVVNNTGGSTCFFASATHGAGTGNTMVTSGPVELEEVVLNCPWSPASGSVITSDYCKFAHTVTASNNSTGIFSYCEFSTGATPAFTMSSSAAISLLNCVIISSNNPAISGAGAGTLTLGNVTFTSNSLFAATLTVAYAPSITTVVVGTNTPGASPQIVNVRSGQVAFTDTIANGAYGTLTLTNSVISSSSIVIACVSCSTVNSALQIVGITPGSGTVAFRIFNGGSASTAANILVNFTVLN